jgi:predicted nucleotidyltransferase
MTDKTFNVGGVSKSKNGYKVRFATDMTRVKILAKTDEDIQLVELPSTMTKPELVTFLKTTDLYNNPVYREAIDTADAKYNPGDTVKVKAAKTPNLADLKARAANKDAELAE